MDAVQLDASQWPSLFQSLAPTTSGPTEALHRLINRVIQEVPLRRMSRTTMISGLVNGYQYHPGNALTQLRTVAAEARMNVGRGGGRASAFGV